MRGHALCPTAAVYNALALAPTESPEGPAFPGISPPYFSKVTLAALKRAGYQTEGLGSHSFRRGGASFLWSTAGVNESQIRALGDWASSAYVLYTISTEQALRKTTTALADAILAED